MTDAEIDDAVFRAGGKWDGDHWVIEDADLYPFVRTILAFAAPPPLEKPATPSGPVAEAWAVLDGIGNVMAVRIEKEDAMDWAQGAVAEHKNAGHLSPRYSVHRMSTTAGERGAVPEGDAP
jgi:hypothetical protein